MQELIAGGQLFVFFDKYNVWEEKNVIMDTKVNLKSVIFPASVGLL